MRFMMLVKADETSEAGVMPSETLLSEMAAYNESLAKAGVLLAGEGLKPTSQGFRVRSAGGKVSVTEGPFRGQNLVAGYWIIRTKSRDEALDWARRVPFEAGEVEVRQVFEVEDFPADPGQQVGDWREKELKFREETGGGQKAAPAAGKGGKQRRYMSFVMADASTEAGVMPDEKALASMGQLMDEAIKAGILLAGEGLQPSSKGACVKFAGGKRTVIDGPFAEAKELVAGFAVFLAGSKQEAIDFARRFVEVDAPLRYNGEAEVEVRPIFELEDFPASEALDRHARLQSELARS